MNTRTASTALRATAVHNLRDASRVVNLTSVLSIDAKIAQLQAARQRHIDNLWSLFDKETGKHDVPGVGSITFSQNNTYDEAAIMAGLRPGQQRLVTKRVLDRAKVRAQYPAVYEAAKRPNGIKAAVKASV